MTAKLQPGAFDAPYIADSAHAVAGSLGNGQLSPGAWPPVPQLRYLERDAPALLLLSINFTHRHAFDYRGFTIEQFSEPQVVMGEYLQRETGRVYQVRVSSEIGLPIDPRPAVQVPAAWTDLFGEALACLREAEPYVTAVSARDPGLQRLAARIRNLTKECPES